MQNSNISFWSLIHGGQHKEAILKCNERPDLALYLILSLSAAGLLSDDERIDILRRIAGSRDHTPEAIAHLVEFLPESVWHSKEGLHLLKQIRSNYDRTTPVFARERLSLSYAKACIWMSEDVDIYSDVDAIERLMEGTCYGGADVKQLVGVCLQYCQFLPLARMNDRALSLCRLLERTIAKERIVTDEMLFALGNTYYLTSYFSRSQEMLLRCMRRTKKDSLRGKAIYLLGLTGLMKGDYTTKNFLLYGCSHAASVRENPYSRISLWNGESGKTVLIYKEQGPGEEIFFSRMSSSLAALYPENRFIFHVSRRLCRVLSKTVPTCSFFTDGDTVDNLSVDAVLHLGSVPYMISRVLDAQRRRTKTEMQSHSRIDNPTSLLSGLQPAERNKKNRYVNRSFDESQHIRIGVVWRSSRTYHGLIKTIGRELMVRLNTLESVELISFQHGMTTEEKAFCVANKIRMVQDVDLNDDWEPVLEEIKNLDCFVGCSTSMAHLAAASGIRTMVGVSEDHSAGFFWNCDANGISHWYPDARIYRSEDGSWNRTIARICSDIHEFYFLNTSL